jgi:hypothetical protein
MSSKLISDPNWQHDFKDDLKSSIYVLLWVMLMYSMCFNAAQVVPFMDGVLDPQAYLKGSGGFAKLDFLCGQLFLTSVKFPGRPKFDTLLTVRLSMSRSVGGLDLYLWVNWNQKPILGSVQVSGTGYPDPQVKYL